METAIVIVVPEAEKVVGRWRREYTPDGVDGMPAHITLLYPFADGSRHLVRMNELAKTAFDGVGLIRFSLTSTDYFYGETNTLYLTPDPPDPFAAVTRALAAVFPEFLPYGGAFSTVVPHLSVAQHERLSVLAEIEEQLKPALPIAAFAAEAQLMEHAPAPDGWRLKRSFALTPPTRPDPGA